MASWNSITLEITYQVLGWLAFFCLTFGFYPQLLLNLHREEVAVCEVGWDRILIHPSFSICVCIIWILISGLLFLKRGGLNFDFVHLSYFIYNAALFFSPVIQREYHEKYGYGAMIPVAANDVAFSIHCNLISAIVAIQILIYERGSQKISKTCIAITSAIWVVALDCTIIAWSNNSWLWLISVLSTIQAFVTALKNIPQAVMSFRRKSTEGLSIGFILLNFLGGLTNFSQMGVQSIDQGTFVNFYGNIGKTFLSLEVAFFDLVLIFQHCLLYPSKRVENYSKAGTENTEPLMKSSGESSQVGNV